MNKPKAAPMSRVSRILSAIPEPFTLSLILTVIAILGALSLGQKTSIELSQSWVRGLWSIQTFAMQMVLCLCSGFALAQAPIIQKGLTALCQKPKSYAQSVWIVAALSMLLGTLHWGLGLAGGTLLVRQMQEVHREKGWLGHDGLLAAAGYLPMMIWHGGLSGSAPLLMATPGNFMAAQTGSISLAATIGHWSNLLTMFLLILTLPAICYFWAKNYQKETAPIKKLRSETNDDDMSESNNPEFGIAWIGWITGALGIIFTVMWMKEVGFGKIGLNKINALFLFLALLFHGKLGSFLKAFRQGVLSSWSVILLFPFYGAIMAVVKDSGLAAHISHSLAEVASKATLPIYTFFSSGLLNVFIPSGGGQWVVQGPIVVAAGKEVGLSPELMIMAVAYGDQLTNMLQPFWALPLLGMTKVLARDLLRFTIPLMFFGGALMALGLLLRLLYGS